MKKGACHRNFKLLRHKFLHFAWRLSLDFFAPPALPDWTGLAPTTSSLPKEKWGRILIDLGVSLFVYTGYISQGEGDGQVRTREDR